MRHVWGSPVRGTLGSPGVDQGLLLLALRLLSLGGGNRVGHLHTLRFTARSDLTPRGRHDTSAHLLGGGNHRARSPQRPSLRVALRAVPLPGHLVDVVGDRGNRALRGEPLALLPHRTRGGLALLPRRRTGPPNADVPLPSTRTPGRAVLTWVARCAGLHLGWGVRRSLGAYARPLGGLACRAVASDSVPEGRGGPRPLAGGRPPVHCGGPGVPADLVVVAVLVARRLVVDDRP